MTITNRPLTFACLVALTALAASWYGLQRYFSLSTTSFKPTQHDAFMQDIEYTHYDDQGQIKRQVSAPVAFHQADTDGLVLEHPVMTFYDDHYHKWTIRANHGESSQQNSQVVLSDHVEIEQAATAERPTLHLYTDNLTLYPNQRLASTNAAVKIVQPDGQVEATGMQADFNNQTITLLSQAHATYYATRLSNNAHQKKHVASD